jgi:hypothetical protein
MYLTFLLNNRQPAVTQREISIDDIFAGITELPVVEAPVYSKAPYKTKTVITHRAPRNTDTTHLQQVLQKLIDLTRHHTPEEIVNEYNTFFIPKRSGGLREINAPKEQLMADLKEMQEIIQYELKVLYHDAAYAYVPRRNIKTALEKHKKYNSKWFLKMDIKDFFPNCNQEFVVNMLKKIYPFCMYSEEDINKFIWICFRNDQLPQGTPMSPMLTNLIMIPIDYAIQEYAKENNLVYTRYADDILISSYCKWDYKLTERAINTIFSSLQTPFQLKSEKTRFGSSSGRNWNLGLMLNKDNNITVGYRNKKNYRAMLNNLMIAEASAHFWDYGEIQHFQGVTSYYLSIEPDYFKPLIQKYENMYNLTLKEIYKRAL